MAEAASMLPNLFAQSDSGFFTCTRIRPPSTFDGACESVVDVISSNAVTLVFEERTQRVPSRPSSNATSESIFLVDGALATNSSDDDV